MRQERAAPRLRHAGRRRRLALLVLRPRRVEDARAGAEVARRARSTSAAASSRAFEAAELERDPERRARLADVRRRRRRADRRRDGGPDRRARPRRAARGLPLGRHADRRACCSSRPPTASCASFPDVALAEGAHAARAARRDAARRPHRRRRRRPTRSRSAARTARSSRSPPARRSGRPASPPPTWRRSSHAEAGLDVDRAGRITVEPDLTSPRASGGARARRHGARAGRRRDGHAAPGLAPVAMQQGRYAARAIRDRLRGRTPGAFHYVDKGNLATIGRSKAVADVKGAAPRRVRRLGDVAPRPPLLPDRLPEQAARRAPLDDQLRHPRPRGPADRPPPRDAGGGRDPRQRAAARSSRDIGSTRLKLSRPVTLVESASSSVAGSSVGLMTRSAARCSPSSR